MCREPGPVQVRALALAERDAQAGQVTTRRPCETSGTQVVEGSAASVTSVPRAAYLSPSSVTGSCAAIMCRLALDPGPDSPTGSPSPSGRVPSPCDSMALRQTCPRFRDSARDGPGGRVQSKECNSNNLAHMQLQIEERSNAKHDGTYPAGRPSPCESQPETGDPAPALA